MTNTNKVTKKTESNTKEDEVKLLRKDWNEVDKKLDTMNTKSGKIRYLLSKNWSRSHISKKLGVIYQHVRNVEITPVKQHREEVK